MGRVYNGSAPLSQNYKVGCFQPLDIREIVNSFSDLLDVASSFYETVYEGMRVLVLEDGCVYQLVTASENPELGKANIIDQFDFEDVSNNKKLWKRITIETVTTKDALNRAKTNLVNGALIYLPSDIENTLAGLYYCKNGSLKPVGGGGGSSVGVNLIKSPNFEGSEWVSGEHEIRDDVVARANAVELPQVGYIGTSVDVEAGKRYTLSFTFFEATRSNSLEDGAVRFGSNISDVVYTNDVNQDGMWWEEDSKSLKLHGENLPQRVVCSFTALNEELYIEFSNGGKFANTLCQYWHVKLEEGDTATEWTDWKSDSLVSGFGIKTINGQSILGSGNINIEGDGGGGYQPPVGGIPRGDLASDVQTSLSKADTALQEGALSEYAKKSEVPANTSELNNDSGYVTGEEVADMVGTPIVDNTSGAAVEPTALRVWNEIEPNKLYVWGEIASLELEFVTPADDSIVNEYMVQFTSGATATTLTLPDTIKWMAAPNIQPNKTYQLSVINNFGVIGEFGHE